MFFKLGTTQKTTCQMLSGMRSGCFDRAKSAFWTLSSTASIASRSASNGGEPSIVSNEMRWCPSCDDISHSQHLLYRACLDALCFANRTVMSSFWSTWKGQYRNIRWTLESGTDKVGRLGDARTLDGEPHARSIPDLSKRHKSDSMRNVLIRLPRGVALHDHFLWSPHGHVVKGPFECCCIYPGLVLERKRRHFFRMAASRDNRGHTDSTPRREVGDVSNGQVKIHCTTWQKYVVEKYKDMRGKSSFRTETHRGR